MAQQQRSIDLEIPAQEPPQKGGIDLKPRALEKWTKGLPLGNIQETTRLVLSAIHEINRTVIPAQDRFKIMETLRNPAEYCAQSLKKQIVDHVLPLTPKAVSHWEHAQKILQESSTGYEIICADQLSGNSRLDKKMLSYSLYRAIRILGKQLLLDYQLYAPVSPGIWKELHKLFHYAELNQLLDVPIKDPDNAHSKLNSINKAYKQLVLLSLANPYHLFKGEAEVIYQALDRWAQYAELYILEEGVKADSKFYCQLDSDLPPQHILKKTVLDASANRLLDLGMLKVVLEKEMKQADTAANSSQFAEKLYAEVLQRLLNAWEIRISRNFPRIHTRSSMNISIGLNNTSQLIAGTDEQPAAENITEQAPANMHPSERDLLLDTPTEFSIMPLESDLSRPGSTLLNSKMAYDKPKDTIYSAIKSSVRKPENWKTVNASAGGYCLLWDREGASHTAVGEIVGIRDENGDSSQPWSIGVVRWMQYIKDKGVKLGVQIIALDATAAMIRQPSDSRGAEQKSYHCLLLAGARDINQPPSLITPKNNNLSVGDSIALDNQGKTAHVKLTRLMENSRNISRYMFQPIQKQKMP